MFHRYQTIGKFQKSCSVCPVGVRSDEGDATAEAESKPLDCSGPGNQFVFLCNFIGRSNQLNLPPMTQFLLFLFQQKNWPQSAVGRKIYGRFMRVLSFSCITHQEAMKILLECGQKTPMGQIMLCRDQATRKCQRSCSVRPVGIRSDEGDVTAEAESILLH